MNVMGKTKFILFSITLCLLWICCESNRREKTRKKILDTNRVRNIDDVDGNYQELSHCNLNGLWYNQLGSELYINHTDENNFCGEYRTAVHLEETRESADEVVGVVKGRIIGRLFTFNVFFKNGESVATWTGHCHKPCDMGYFSSEHTTLHTQWLLTSRVDTCDQHWMSTRTGQDIFTRDATIKSGPRRSSSGQNGERI